MTDQTALPLMMQAVMAPLVNELRSLLHQHDDQIIALLMGFLSQSVTPAGTFRLEHELQAATREACRQVLETVLNQLDPEAPADTPPRRQSEGSAYRRRHTRTSHSAVATLFGQITLWRYTYRPCEESGACLIPLEEELGLVAGCTPALAERAARLVGQRQVWGVELV